MGGVWGGRVDVGEDEGVILHSQTSMAHYPASQFQPITHDVEYSHPRSVLRGFAEIDHIDQGIYRGSLILYTSDVCVH